MKTTISLFITVLFLSLSFSVSAQKKDVPKEMLKKWSFVMEDPQTGGAYDGVCTITQKEKETKATFTIGDQSTETTAFRPNDNGKFYADLEVQGYPMGVSFDMLDGKLICVLDGGSWNFPLEMSLME
ncbi:MAG: hypothetical protein LBH58_08775 [Tannerellaceae bacterium]|nr:hypothetical protein [Tannerellaceae bacterium]